MPKLSDVSGRSPGTKWLVTSPDGQKYEVNAPADATQDQVMAYAQSQAASQGDELAGRRRLAELEAKAANNQQPRSKFGGVPVDPAQGGPWEKYQAQGKPFAQHEGTPETIEVEMPDGTILEFPGNTPPDVMQRASQQYYAESAATQANGPWNKYRAQGTNQDRIALALEAEKRGILPPEKAALLAEARKRGLVPPQGFQMASSNSSSPSHSGPDRLSQLAAALAKADAAGNVEDAKALAAAYRRERDSRQRQPTESNAPEVSGFLHDQGLGLRSTLTGITDVAGIVTNPIMYAISKAAGKESPTLSNQITGRRDRFPYESFSDATGRFLDRLGVPRPANAQERVYSDVGRSLSSTGATLGFGGFVGPGNSLTGAIGRGLTSHPGMQTLGAVTGSTAAGLTRENGGSEGEQVAAGILGTLAPGGLRYATAGGLRGLLRGGENGRQQVQANLDTFRRAGTSPTVSQATGGRAITGLEALLAKTPGASGRMAANAERQQTQIGGRVESLATSLSPRSTSTDAGRAIERGIKGDGGFVDTFKARAGAMYGEADKFVSPTARVPASNTQKILASEASKVPGAANISELLSNPKLAAIRSALEADLTANGGALPYDALKRVRSKIGELIADNGLLSDIPTKALKRVYGALSEDMRSAIHQTGNPAAIRAFERANNYYLVGTKRLEAIESVLNRSGGPEAVYGAALSGTKEGASRFRAVMQSLKPEDQRVVSAAMLRRLGRASSSQQDELGERFSLNTFLTNWNALSREARSAAFGRYGPKFATDLDQIAKAAAISRRGAATYANPSGTGPVTLQVGTGLGLLMAMLQGQWGASTAIGGTVLSANLAARFLTNPARAAWLANATKLPTYALAQQATVLGRMADRDQDPELKRFAQQLEQAAQKEAQANQRSHYRQAYSQ